MFCLYCPIHHVSLANYLPSSHFHPSTLSVSSSTSTCSLQLDIIYRLELGSNQLAVIYTFTAIPDPQYSPLIMSRKKATGSFTKRCTTRPQKNKGITAGRARPAGDIDGAVINGKEVCQLITVRLPVPTLINMQKEKENEDDCAACGGRGALLCCDNCVRSFHWTCLEPPQDQSQPPPGSWFCRACVAQENDQAVRYGHEAVEDPRLVVPETAGLFKPLFSKMHGSTERSFALPKVCREAFEGVKTGETGEYEEVQLPRSR